MLTTLFLLNLCMGLPFSCCLDVVRGGGRSLAVLQLAVSNHYNELSEKIFLNNQVKICLLHYIRRRRNRFPIICTSFRMLSILLGFTAVPLKQSHKLHESV